jgi:hypothetical protein
MALARGKLAMSRETSKKHNLPVALVQSRPGSVSFAFLLKMTNDSKRPADTRRLIAAGSPQGRG